MPFTTDDLAQRRAKKLLAEETAPREETSDNSSGAIRFTLRELLIAVTVIGVLLGLLRALGIFGALLAFLATALFTWVIYPKWRPHNVGGQQAMFDFLWGVGMPLVCLVFDPFLFKEAGLIENTFADDFGAAALVSQAKVYDYGFLVYAFVGCQMLALTLWLMLGAQHRRWAPLMGGFLASGVMFAALVGIVLVIPAIIGALVLGIGLLGMTPLMTTYSYGRQCHRALSELWRSPTKATGAPLAALGFCLSLLAPSMIGLALLAALRGFDAVGNLLRDL